MFDVLMSNTHSNRGLYPEPKGKEEEDEQIKLLESQIVMLEQRVQNALAEKKD